MKKYLILLAVLFVGVFLFSGLQNKETQKGFFYDDLPVSHSDCEVVKHTYYSLCYSKKHEQASWVYYLLSDSMIVGSSERKNYFPSYSKTFNWQFFNLEQFNFNIYLIFKYI